MITCIYVSLYPVHSAVFNHRCGAGLFNCSQTECISSNKLCDGVADCKTNPGADEDHSICGI